MKVIVFACDLYADIAPAYWYLHQKNWPDCPYPVEFVTNSEELQIDAFVHYLGHPDLRFGSRLRDFVKNHFGDPNGLMLVMMIDYLIRTSVYQPFIDKAEALCKADEIRHVRLKPMPHPPEVYEPDPDFGIIDKKARYSLSLQPGIWDAQLLHDLCQDDESPYHTETHGSSRVKHQRGMFLSARTPAIVHHNYYKKKRAQDWAVNWVKANVPKELWPNDCR